MLGRQLNLSNQLLTNPPGLTAYVALFEVMDIDIDRTIDFTSSLVDGPACAPTPGPGC